MCLPEPRSTFARGSIGSSWNNLEVSCFPCSGFPQNSVEVLSSTKFPLNSSSQSCNSCDISLCTSSCSPFLFLFSVFSVDSCSGSPRSSSLVLSLLSCTGFSMYLLTSNTESCDEDDGEVGEGVVEEELVDKPGTTNGTSLDILQSIILPFLMRCGFWLLQWYENPWSESSNTQHADDTWDEVRGQPNLSQCDIEMCAWRVKGVLFTQSLHGTCPQISQRRDFAETLTFIFPNDGPFFSRILAWQATKQVFCS